ncbi:hypothetical protein VB620_18325 [Nodularia harveyana UHCC-0300]|uniref:Zinc ribbon domain-containing protein n=1 Tax=Nodularia harveyana UHCC-0300 TaxID=2974287 RepID=A0ABU5UIH1_9CYAN|nr:hypothetical protein [Nodularia harveyana]MEA5583289.1 hypothetical protein [Nodularia harveyana UHCC-0300]
MVQLKCPVCGQEYIEGAVEFCSKCHWLLTPYSQDLVENSEVQQREEQRLQSAKKVWESYKHDYSELKKRNSSLQQQLKVVTKQNQPPLKYLSVEKSLQEISSNTQHLSNIQCLPDILSTLQQINEKLPLNVPAHLADSNQEDTQPTIDSETKLEVSEIDNDLLIGDDISSINDTPEATDLVQNYNQQSDFPEKIEVSETESSKLQRMTGSQTPAFFERNHRSRGEYWIIDNKYLVLKPKQKINKNSYETVVTLFECRGYDQNSSDKMMLIKPAKVSLIDGEEKWQLQETGIIGFS